MVFRVAASSAIVGVVVSVVPPPYLPSYYPTDDARSFSTFKHMWYTKGEKDVCSIDGCQRALQSPKTDMFSPVPCGQCRVNFRPMCVYGSNWIVTFCSENGTSIYEQEYEDGECTKLCTSQVSCPSIHACAGSERGLVAEQDKCDVAQCMGERVSDTCCQDCNMPGDPCFNSWTNYAVTPYWEEIVENGGALV